MRLAAFQVPLLGVAVHLDKPFRTCNVAMLVATGWRLPQEWSLNLIQEEPATKVTGLSLNSDNQGSWNLSVGEDGGVLAVVALAPYTSTKASYWLSIVPQVGDQ